MQTEQNLFSIRCAKTTVSRRPGIGFGVTGLSAVLTPPDLISMTSLALPMLLLYEGSVIAVKIVEKRRAAAEIQNKST